MSRFEEKINRLAEEVATELQQAGIFPSTDILEIKENRRAKKRLGCCKKVKKGNKIYFVIEISSVLEGEEDQMIKEVLAHEFLHTCPGCFNHRKAWKRKAEIMNRKYGYKIKTYVDNQRLNIEKPKEKMVKYEIECISCGYKSYRKKKSKVILNPQLYRCGKCGGMLKVREI